ncbi:MAG: Cof-type HAD-IIB family hydrolase [Acidimicrobiales bacterium]
MSRPAIRLVLSDVDGTLITSDQRLTSRTVAAVSRLRESGVLFAITSGRPPRGLVEFVEPLHLTTPISAFNGGVIVDEALSVLEERPLPAELVRPTIEVLDDHAMTVWLYQGAQWYVRDATSPHVEREVRAVRFEPTAVETFDGLDGDVAKVVGVSDDPGAVAAAHSALRDDLGHHVAATSSQSYYLDVTHPQANKGAVADMLSRRLGVPASQIAAIGDGPNDILMFAHAGLSVAMGNAATNVQGAAGHVTASNDHDGFALAVERLVLG